MKGVDITVPGCSYRKPNTIRPHIFYNEQSAVDVFE